MLSYFARIQTDLFLCMRLSADRWATAVEYGLMIGIVSALLIVTLKSLGVSLSSIFSQATAPVVVH